MIKYVCRCEYKGNKLQDLKKAQWYLNRCVQELEAMDELVWNLAWEFNKIHCEGTGLEQFDSIRSTNAVDDADSELNDASLRFTPQNGSFNIRVHNVSSGLMETINIQVDLDGIGADETLNTLAGKINSAMTTAGLSVSATVNSDNTLSIESTQLGTEFSFSDDTSHVLATLGINTFFTGHDTGTIAVNEMLVDNINLIAAGLSTNNDDGDNADRMVELSSQSLDALSGVSIESQYRAIISDLAIDASISRSRGLGAGAYKESLIQERETISGVNLDEETINLVRYQRAYQAAARYISTIDEAFQEMLRLI